MAKQQKVIQTTDFTNQPLPQLEQYPEPSGEAFLNKRKIDPNALRGLVQEAEQQDKLQEGIKGEWFGLTERNKKFARASFAESLEATWTNVKDTTLVPEIIRRVKENKDISPQGIILSLLSDSDLIKNKEQMQDFLAVVQPIGDQKNALSKEQIKQDPDLYREELYNQFDPKENLNYQMYKDRVERYDARQRAKIINEREVGWQKATNFVAMLGENLIIDLPFNIATGGIAGTVAKGVAKNSLTKAVIAGGLVGGTENLIQGEIIEKVTEKRLISEGESEKTDQERMIQRFFDFGFGGALGIGGSYIGFRMGQKTKPSTIEQSDVATDFTQVQEKISGILSMDKTTINENQSPQLKSYNIKTNEGIYVLPTDFTLSDGNKIKTNYKIVELEEILKKRDEGYPKFLDSETKLPTMEGTFSPEDLIISRDLQSGSPLITEDGILINGNKRLDFISDLYTNANGKGYIDTINQLMPQMGAGKYKQPVFVRAVRGEFTEAQLKNIRETANTPNPVLSKPEFQKVNQAYNNANLNNLYLDRIPETDALFKNLEYIADNVSIVKNLIDDAKIANNLDISSNIADAFFIHSKVKENNMDLRIILNTELRERIDPMTESILRSFYKNEEDLGKLLPENKINKIFDDFYEKIKESNLESDISPLRLFEDIKKQQKNEIVSADTRANIDDLYYSSKKVEESKGFTKEEIEAMPTEDLKQQAKDLTETQKVEANLAENVINCLIS